MTIEEATMQIKEMMQPGDSLTFGGVTFEVDETIGGVMTDTVLFSQSPMDGVNRRCLALGIAVLLACAGCAPRPKVMLLGDSLTLGITIPLINEDGGYPRRLAEAMPSVDFVGSVGNREGHGSWTASMLGQRLPGWLGRYDPETVVIMAGTNDLIRDKADPSEVVRRVHSLVLECGSRKVYLLPIPPTTQVRPAFSESIREDLNKRLAKVPGVTFVDTKLVASDLSGDGIHLTNDGYAKIASAVQEALPYHQLSN